MANLSYRDSFFQDLFDFRRDFDHIFNRFLSGRQGAQTGQRSETSLSAFAPAVEAYVDHDGKKFVCRVALPGVDPKEVSIQVQGNVLSISGERNVSNERKEADFVHSEMMYGYFERDVALPEGTDPSKLEAEYQNGVLEISAPMSAAALPRRIEIKSGESRAKQMGAGGAGR
jgi:HSP20 family protein